MALKFFTVPIRDNGASENELNAFLIAQRVLSVERRFVEAGENSFWAICVDYLPTLPGGPGSGRCGLCPDRRGQKLANAAADSRPDHG